MIEPEGRNTAPAACIAALIAAGEDEDALVLLAPSDHMVGDKEGFARAIESGVPAAEAGVLVVFGVEPDCPHTGYGYIETEAGNSVDFRVKRFVEKPKHEVAEAYLDAGGFYWNAGIFLFKAKTMLDLLDTHAPEILEASRKALDRAIEDLNFRVLDGVYRDAPSISLDYAVAEKAGNIALRAAHDHVERRRLMVGAVEFHGQGQRAATWSRAKARSSSRDTRDSLAYSDHGCVALVGVEDMVVVAMEDAVLVASKDDGESIKRVVDHLKGNGGDLALQHNRVYRPWGWYQSLNRGDRYQVKCIMVRPGGKLSLQSHHHRSEHWVVVTGTVEVTRGADVASC